MITEPDHRILRFVYRWLPFFPVNKTVTAFFPCFVVFPQETERHDQTSNQPYRRHPESRVKYPHGDNQTTDNLYQGFRFFIQFSPPVDNIPYTFNNSKRHATDDIPERQNTFYGFRQGLLDAREVIQDVAAQRVQRTRQTTSKIRADLVTGQACHRAELAQGGHEPVGAFGRLVSIETDGLCHRAVLAGESP
ncbi:Uncharacterised protein [Salmonella enterica subsp. enterica serovar Typhi]|nr:Uncharacterised protein [Salmonella enterica subsp. enterica serovar Typhi]